MTTVGPRPATQCVLHPGSGPERRRGRAVNHVAHTPPGDSKRGDDPQPGVAAAMHVPQDTRLTAAWPWNGPHPQLWRLGESCKLRSQEGARLRWWLSARRGATRCRRRRGAGRPRATADRHENDIAPSPGARTGRRASGRRQLQIPREEQPGAVLVLTRPGLARHSALDDEERSRATSPACCICPRIRKPSSAGRDLMQEASSTTRRAFRSLGPSRSLVSSNETAPCRPSRKRLAGVGWCPLGL